MAEQELDALQQVAGPQSAGLYLEGSPTLRSETELKVFEKDPTLICTVERGGAIIVQFVLKIIIDSGLGES